MDIKPCPFCGEIPKITKVGKLYYLRCCNINCTANPMSTPFYDKQEAIEAWNTRTPEDCGVKNG